MTPVGDLLALIHRDGGHYLHEHGLEKTCLDAGRIVTELREEVEGLQALFDLQQTRMERATAAWREATGQHDVLPDLGRLLDWLLEKDNG